MAITLGIDPSTHTGLVALEGISLLEATEIGCLKKYHQTIDRALNLSDQMVRIVERNKPELLVFEGYGYANKHTLVPLVEIGTAFRMTARLLGVPYIEVPPTSLKKIITGSGNAGKDHIILEVFKRWGYEAKTNNIADAYGLAIIGQEVTGYDTGLTKAQKECLSKLKSVNK